MIVYRFRVKLHAILGIHPFDRDPCEYDATICFAESESHIARSLLQFLEERRYKVCYLERDLTIG